MNLNDVVKPTPPGGTGNLPEVIDARFVTRQGRPAVSRLDVIRDWEVRAEQVRFNVAALAKGCGVTDRQLRRYFQTRFGSTPHSWMALARLQKVQPLLSGGALVKEAAASAGFSRQGNFTRQFKLYYNARPIDFRSPPSTATTNVRFR